MAHFRRNTISLNVNVYRLSVVERMIFHWLPRTYISEDGEEEGGYLNE